MLELKDEFLDLFDFFNQDEEIKIEKFKETLERTVEFSEKVKDVFINGTKEEKEQLQEFLSQMQEKIETQKNKMFEKMGVSEEELKEFITNQENFSESEWSSMQGVKDYVQETVGEDKPQVRRKKSKTAWIQS